MRRHASISALLIAFVAASAARGGQVTIETKFASTYYKCIRPASTVCITYSEEDKSRCAHCQEWSTVVVVRPVVSTIDESPYLHKSRNANLFLKDVLTEYYQLPEEQARRLTPARIAWL